MYVLNDYIRILTTQNNRVLDIDINLVDRNFITIDTLSGVVTGGNISIDANNKVRRQCDIEMIVKESKYGVGYDKTIWLDKYIKIIIKVFDNLTQQFIPFDFGYFALNNPSIKYDATNHNLSFTGMDLMSKFSKDVGGNQLKERLKIEANAPLNGFIRGILSIYGKFPEDRMMINTDKIMPYMKEWKPENDLLDVLDEVRQIYMNYEMYISEDGIFYYQQRPIRDNDPIWVDFSEITNSIISIDEKFDFQNVKNVIIVNGMLKDDKSQPSYTIKNEDNRSPFSIKNLGEERVLVYNEGTDKYTTEQMCKDCAEYIMYLHNDLNESISVACIPMYHLTVNKKIRLYDEGMGLDKICLCTSVNIPLNVEDTMSFECIEVRSKGQ